MKRDCVCGSQEESHSLLAEAVLTPLLLNMAGFFWVGWGGGNPAGLRMLTLLLPAREFVAHFSTGLKKKHASLRFSSPRCEFH